jgi:hypothetical protein
MAHFCQLDENNVVTQVIVVANSDTADASGVEKEHIGAAFCEKLLGGTWKQTSLQRLHPQELRRTRLYLQHRH